jgi:very-short-patch-repair endonuclease
MDPQRLPSTGVRRKASSQFWDLAGSQHGVVTRTQLLELGMGPDSIKHRLGSGRLHPLWRGVYVVGRPEVSREGRWMGAVLGCGPDALLSHRSAAVLWGLVRASGRGEIHVVIPRKASRRRPGICAHRRAGLGPEHRREVVGIPVTDLASTLVDLASCAPEWQVEQAINEADRRDLIDPEALSIEIRALSPRPGMACMRRLLGLDALTDTGLERKFLALARAAGLPSPRTQVQLNGYRVDFYWPELGLVVEADGWAHHRTPGEQTTDRRRDQAHAAAGLTPLRFSEHQIRYAPDEVKRPLRAVARRLSLSGRRKHLG